MRRQAADQGGAKTAGQDPLGREAVIPPRRAARRRVVHGGCRWSAKAKVSSERGYSDEPLVPDSPRRIQIHSHSIVPGGFEVMS